MNWKLPLITACIGLAVITKGTGTCLASESKQEPVIVTVPAVESRTVMTSEIAQEVLVVNALMLGRELSGIVDVANLTQISAADVRKKIDHYFIPDVCIYLDGVLRQEGDLDPVISRRNVSAIADPVALRYGVVIDNTAVRAYPSWQKLSKENTEEAADYFQESMFMIGEGVVVLHQTADEIWSFVQGSNACGWIETDEIAFCQREEMKMFSNPENFVVVTEDTILAGEEELRMGTKLPLARMEGEHAVVWIPKSNENGNLYQSEVWIHAEGGINIGYLTLSEEMILEQAYNLIDMPFGWGDTGGFMDCSSALGAIYRCFGVILPRETQQLVYAGETAADISQMSENEKYNRIIGQAPDTILLMEDHAVLYLGVNSNGLPMIFHNVEAYSTDQVTVTEVYRSVVTPLMIYTPDGDSYLSRFTHMISF